MILITIDALNDLIWAYLQMGFCLNYIKFDTTSKWTFDFLRYTLLRVFLNEGAVRLNLVLIGTTFLDTLYFKSIKEALSSLVPVTHL